MFRDLERNAFTRRLMNLFHALITFRFLKTDTGSFLTLGPWVLLGVPQTARPGARCCRPPNSAKNASSFSEVRERCTKFAEDQKEKAAQPDDDATTQPDPQGKWAFTPSSIKGRIRPVFANSARSEPYGHSPSQHYFQQPGPALQHPSQQPGLALQHLHQPHPVHVAQQANGTLMPAPHGFPQPPAVPAPPAASVPPQQGMLHHTPPSTPGLDYAAKRQCHTTTASSSYVTPAQLASSGLSSSQQDNISAMMYLRGQAEAANNTGRYSHFNNQGQNGKGGQ